MDLNKERVSSNSTSGTLDARIGMALAYWAYPHKDESKANKVLPYPDGWEPARPGKAIPSSWLAPEYDHHGRLKPGSPDGWNTQHNDQGQLENQFKVSINRETKEITFDFKGSDAWSNWWSDLANAGASEFAKIQAKAQAAFEHLSQHPEFRHFRFAATGHSLGGGMAQSFALRNNIDAYVYNSLPIARGTIASDYFASVGGFDAAMARYQTSGRQVHDVRTPNDIATHAFEGVMQNRYLSRHVGDGPQWLPGARLPDFLKTAILASKAGTVPAALLMGQDHTMERMANTQQGLSTDALGRYRIPEGHQDFARIPAEVRRRFALLDASPIAKATRLSSSQEPGDLDRFQVSREDGSRQYISVDPRSGAVEIDHYSAQGGRTRIDLNERRGHPARIHEYDAQDHLIRQEVLAMHEPQGQPTRLAGAVPSDHKQLSSADLSRQIGPQLRAVGLNDAQIERVSTAALLRCQQEQITPERFVVSKDGQRLGILYGQGMQELPLAETLQGNNNDHQLPEHAQTVTKRSSAASQAAGYPPARA